MKRMIYYTSTEKHSAVMGLKVVQCLVTRITLSFSRRNVKQWLTPLNVMGVKKLTADYGRRLFTYSLLQ